MRFLFTLALIAGPAFAECPDPADRSDDLELLFDKARDAKDAMEGRRVSAQMWQVWLAAPDDIAQELLDRGMRRRDIYDFAGALKDFKRLAEYCPNYAEGFNQSAFIHYLTNDFESALADLDVALFLQPMHVAAQSGRGLTLMQLGRIAEARAQMLVAVVNNPWLSEASLLEKGAPLGLVGEDL